MSPGKTKQAVQARNKLWNEIWAGRVVRQDACETCGNDINVDAHHDDYSQPLAIRWLCKSCHKRHHIALQRAAGTYTRRKPEPYHRLAPMHPAVLALAAEYGITDSALKKWRSRGVPAKYRSIFSSVAERRGIDLPRSALRACPALPANFAEERAA